MKFDEYLTITDVSKVMRVHSMTVYRLIHSGELPAIKIGKSYRVPSQVLEKYLSNQFIADNNKYKSEQGK